ncbi:MAG: EamA family transporter [Actinobacteria bacterium]|nr:EamA family transporter [Actinomycetota bacterium]
MKSKRYSALIFAGICFGSTGTAQALGPDGISPLAVGSARLICGTLLLWVFTLTKNSKKSKIASTDLWLAAIGFTIYQLAFFSAVKSTGVSIGTVTALGSAPALTGLISWLINREKPTGRWFVATIITTLGIIVLSNAKGFSEFNLNGFMMAIAAGAAFSLFAVTSKRALNTGIDSTLAMSKIFLLAALLGTPFLFVGQFSPFATTGGVVMILWLGLVPTALAYIAYGYGLHGVRASTSSTLILSEPATATLLAAVVLNESLNTRSWTGIAIIALGLIYLSQEKTKA